MEVKVDVVQPEASEVVRGRQLERESPPSIPPVERGDRSSFRKAEKERQQPEKREQAEKLSQGEVEELVGEAQSFLEDLNIRLNFKVHDDTGELVVRVLNKDTEEVIRQIPPEDLLKLHQKLVELRGVMFDKKA